MSSWSRLMILRARRASDDRRGTDAEIKQYVAAFVDKVDEDRKRLVVPQRRARESKLTVGSGTVAIKAPRVHDKRVDPDSGERKKFSSRILKQRTFLGRARRPRSGRTGRRVIVHGSPTSIR
jgi:hypothetical protein